MVLFALFTGIIIGKLRNGKLEKLGYLRFQHTKFLILAAGFKVIVFILGISLFETSPEYLNKIILGTYLLTVLFLALNIELSYFKAILSGTIINMVSFIYNGLKTGITLSAAKKTFEGEILDLLIKGSMELFRIIPDRSFYRGKFFSLKDVFGTPYVISAGDIIVLLGIILFVQSVMSDRRVRKGRKIKFSSRMRI